PRTQRRQRDRPRVRAQEVQGVDVVVVAPRRASRGQRCPPVETGRGRAARVPGQEVSDGLPAPYRVALLDGGPYRLVGRPQTVGVVDGQHRTAGDVSRERHRAVGGGADGVQRVGGEVHPAVPGAPALRRRIVGGDDPDRNVEWSTEIVTRGPGGRGHGRDDGEAGDGHGDRDRPVGG